MGKIQCYKRNHDNLFQMMKKLELNMQLTPPNELSCQSKFLGAYPTAKTRSLAHRFERQE